MIFGKKTDPNEGRVLLSDRNIFDVHTHILPGIDDGSRNTEESLQLLRELSAQGVKTVVATPHYYPAEMSPEDFLLKRGAAVSLLLSKCDETVPKIKIGAEVLYFRGLGRIETLERLCVEGTKTLLLEMPTDSWSEYMLREISEIQTSHNIDVVMAHIERYFDKQPSAVMNRLFDSGVLMQINASSLLGKQRKKLVKLLSDGKIHFIGSDCHNMTTRGVRMAEAVSVIKNFSSEDVPDRLERYSLKYFN